uniref:LIM zinc-binding domain-containing protein n=1 Tax=Aegilops tauschii subsp. strangulata TaxID=200361 RepID=A0A453K331_AEGTS
RSGSLLPPPTLFPVSPKLSCPASRQQTAIPAAAGHHQPRHAIYHHIIITHPKACRERSQASLVLEEQSSSLQIESSGEAMATSFQGTTTKCNACDKTVYLVDKLTADNRVYHKACFRCHHCKGTLKLANYNSFEGVLYCRPHFDQLFKRTGSLDKSFEGTALAYHTAFLCNSSESNGGMLIQALQRLSSQKGMLGMRMLLKSPAHLLAPERNVLDAARQSIQLRGLL